MSSDGSSESLSYTALTPQHFILRRNIGNLSTNPFLNFLASLRPKMRHVAARTIVDRAMRLWNKMDAKERKPYNDMARLARRKGTYTGPGARAHHLRRRSRTPRHVGRSRRQRGRSRSRSSRRRQRRSSSRSSRRNRPSRRIDPRRRPRRDRYPVVKIRRRL